MATMTEFVPYDTAMAGQVAALWHKLYPEWEGASDTAEVNKILAAERVVDAIAVLQGDRLVATVCCSRQKSPDGSSNIWIALANEPDSLSADAFSTLLAQFSHIDAETPGTWHIIAPIQRFPHDLEAVLTASGFKLDRMTREMEWTGDAVPLVDAGALRVQAYGGGDPRVDRAIIDLHNRSYRSLRLVTQMDETNVWKPYGSTQTARGMVICWDEDRIASFAEWSVLEGKPVVTSIVCARSHWGTAAAAAAGTRAMQHLVDLGFRRLLTYASTSNAAAHKLHLRHGWREVKVTNPIYIRKF